MKKKFLGILVASAIFCVGGVTGLVSCGPTEGPSEQQSETVITSIEFEKSSYEVKNGDKVTVKGAPNGVKYRLKDPIEGVSLNETSGQFTFDEKRLNYPDGILIATYGDLDPVTCIVKFVTNPDLPVVTINNLSNYIVDGEYVSASAILENTGESLAVEFSLKVEVVGVKIDPESGKVNFLDAVKDGTKFTVVATSKSISVEREFVALIDNIVKPETMKFVTKLGEAKNAKFKINFNGNVKGDEETTSENAAVLYRDQLLGKKDYSYDPASKTITIKKEFVATLPVGENTLLFVTKRNNVPLNLVVASEIIYGARQIKDIFGIDYTPYITDNTKAPSFNLEALKGYYVLGDDLDLNELYDADKYYSHYGFLPIGYAAEGDIAPYFRVPFEGTFDGNGHTINNFKFNHNDQHFWAAGMFGFNTGTIKNFTLKGEIQEIRGWTGILCGKNAGTIENIIVDVNLPIKVETSYSGLISVNNGTVRNVILLNDKIEAQTSKNNGGYIVGWNGIGQMHNCFAVKSSMPTRSILDDNGSEITVGAPLDLYGRFDQLNGANPGLIFENIEELKAYNFKDILPHEFEIAEDGMPTLKVEHEFTGVAKFDVKCNKEFALKGEKFNLEQTILPKNLQEKLLPLITYEVPEGKGISVKNGVVDLTNLSVKPEGELINITAKLEYDGDTFTSTTSFTAYMGITEFRFISLPDTIFTDVNYDINVTSKQLKDIENVKYTLTTKETVNPSWQKLYALDYFVNLDQKARTLSLDEYYSFVSNNTITLTATSDSLTVSKDINVCKVKALPGLNTSVKYEGEISDFEIDVTGLTIESILLDNVNLTNEQFSVTNGKLVIKRDVVSDKEVMHDVIIKTNDNNYFKAYIGATEKVNHNDAWIAKNNANLTHIKTTDDWVKYFITDYAASVNKEFVLDNDLDFTGVKGLLSPYTDAIFFAGKIYGNGHTIKNYNIVSNPDAWSGTGIFNAFDGEVYDLFLENVTATLTSGNRLGALIGTAQGKANTVLRNVHARNCQLSLCGGQSHFHEPNLFFGGLVGIYWTTETSVATTQCNFSTFDGFNSHIVHIR